MTDEEIEAQKKAEADAASQKKTADAVVNAWLRKPIDEDPDKDKDKADEEKQPEGSPAPKVSHRGGVAETIRRAEIAKKQAAAEAEAEKTPEQIAEEEAEAKRKADEEAEKNKDKKPVKFSLRTKKPEAEPEPTPEEIDARKKADEEARQQQQQQQPGQLSDEDKAFVDQLPEEFQDSVEFFRAAEQVDPEKYKGRLQASIDYFKRYDAEVKRLAEDDEDFDPETSPELRRWVKSQNDRPRVGFMEQNRVLQKAAEQRAEERIKQSESRMERERRIAEQRPHIEKIVSDFSEDLSAEIPEEIMATYRTATESGGDAAAALSAISDEHGPEIAQAIERSVNHSADIAEAYVNLTRGITPFDERNPTHTEASNTVVALGKEMLTNPDLEQYRTDAQGRKFMPREVYYSPDTTQAERDKHFTFTEEQVLSMLKTNSKKALKERLDKAAEIIKKREQRILQRHGFDPNKNKDADASAEHEEDDETPPSRFNNDGRDNHDKKPDALVNAMVRGVARDD